MLPLAAFKFIRIATYSLFRFRSNPKVVSMEICSPNIFSSRYVFQHCPEFEKKGGKSLNLRYLISFLRIVKMPGLLPIMQDLQALVRMHFIFAAFESGLLKTLLKPCDRQTLIERLGVERPDLLDALLDVGLAVKELGTRDGLFFIRGKRSNAVTSDRGDMLAAMIQANLTYYSDAYRNASGRLRGGELSDDLQGIGDLVARFSKIGEPIIKDFLSRIVSGRNPLRILDVGCGSGIFLQSAHSANKSATGIGIDVDETVVRQARNNLAEWGLEDRFRIVHGDICRPPREVAGNFDVITLFNILYYFNAKRRAELLRSLRAMLAPDGMLAIAIHCRSRGIDVGAANLNLVNCSLTGLTPLPDLDEIKSMLKECGLRKIDVHRFMPNGTFYGILACNSQT